MLCFCNDVTHLQLLTFLACLRANAFVFPVTDFAGDGARLEIATSLFQLHFTAWQPTILRLDGFTTCALLDTWTTKFAASPPVSPLANLTVDRARHNLT
jgi:hypothetical protein